MENDNYLNSNLSYVKFGIDKITLGLNSYHLNYHKSPDEFKYIIDIITYGDWSELNIQLETNGQSNIDPFYPWLSVLKALEYGISHRLFKEPLASQLFACIYYINKGMFAPISFHNQFFDTGIFKLNEYELFFDFYGYNPFLRFDMQYFLQYKNTLYTRDYKPKFRSDGSKKGVMRSLLAFYNRGLRINCPDIINRLEFRICDFRANAILTSFDLYYSVPQFIEIHGHQISQTVKRYLPENSIDIDNEYIEQNIPVLKKLIWLFNK